MVQQPQNTTKRQQLRRRQLPLREQMTLGKWQQAAAERDKTNHTTVVNTTQEKRQKNAGPALRCRDTSYLLARCLQKKRRQEQHGERYPSTPVTQSLATTDRRRVMVKRRNKDPAFSPTER